MASLSDSSTSTPFTTASAGSAYGGRGPLVLGITWTEFILATALLSLRIYTRLKVVKYAGWALIWAGLAWLWGVVMQSFVTVAVHYGFGNHLEAAFDAGTVIPVAKWSYLSGSLVLVSIGLSKVSVVAFLMAILGVTKKKTRLFLIFIAVSNMLLNLAQVFWAIFRCSPVQKDWNLFLPGTCYSEFGGYEIYSDFIAAYSAFCDFVLALYPILILWELQMALRVKIGLCVLMALGVLAGVCGIMRAVTVQDGYNSTDPTYEGATTILWVWTEMWLVIIASSVPPLWPLIKRVVHKLQSSLTSTRSSGSRRPFRLGRQRLHSAGSPSQSHGASEGSEKPEADGKFKWGGVRTNGGEQRTMPTVNRDSLGITTNWPLRDSVVQEEGNDDARRQGENETWYRESREPV